MMMPHLPAKLRSFAPSARWTRAAIALLACAAQGCAGPDAPAYDWQVVFRVAPNSAMDFTASPDGALFLAGGGGVFRRLPDGCGAADRSDAASEEGCWQRVAVTPEPIVRIYAPSRDEVFALPRSNVLYHWAAPGTAMDTMRLPLGDSIIVDGHYRRAPFVLDLGGTSGRDVYAVGEDGAIQRFDGNRWTLEPNPLVPRPGAHMNFYRDDFFSVGVAGGAVYAGAMDVLVRRAGGWMLIPRPEPAPGDSATVHAIVEAGGKLVVGGGTGMRAYLARFEGGRWRDLSPRLHAFRDVVSGGLSQPDGSAVVWARTGELAVVRGSGVRVTRVSPLRTLYGAALLNGHLYAGGIAGDEYVVVRGRVP
jgi:hypothetical protein